VDGAPLFWVDLTVAPALALVVVAVATARPTVAVRLLNARPLVWLGSFFDSLNLIHLPMVVAISSRSLRCVWVMGWWRSRLRRALWCRCR
jgi:peptidoglycan/LPS O-acetylase OafA/YrhL